MPTDRSTLIERYVIAQFAKVADDLKSTLVQKMQAVLTELYPSCIARSDSIWTFNVVPANNGIPKLDKLEMDEAVNLWECDETTTGRMALWRVRIESKRIVVNCRKNLRKDPGNFDEVQTLLDQVLPLATSVLSISNWNNLSLNYLFHFNSETIDDVSIVKPEWLEVKNLLQPFSALPEPQGFMGYIPNYDWRQQWRQNVKGQEYFSSAIISTISKPFAVRLNLDVSEMQRPVKNVSCRDMFDILKANAKLMFTDNAWKTFGGDCI